MPQKGTLKDPNHRATKVKNLHFTETSAACWEDRKNWLKAYKQILATKTVAPTTLSPATATIIITTSILITLKTVNEMKQNEKLSNSSERHVAKRTTPQRDVIVEQMQQLFPGKAKREERMDLNNKMHRTV